MANIFVRSPYIISINETGQIETKVELFIWNGSGSAPASPTYTLSKLIPAPTQTLTTYNISSYVQEFISHASFANVYSTLTTPSNLEWCNVQIKRYYKTTTTFTLIDTVTHRAFDGYSLYTEGYNKDLGNQLLKGGKTYSYLYKSVADGNLASYPLYRPGDLTIYFLVGEKYRYTNLRTGAVTSFTIGGSDGLSTVPRVRTNNYADGNLVEHLTSANAVLWSATFKPKTECKYEPVCCDFINRYGAWQREYFFKASKSNIEVQNTEYNLLQNTLVNFDVLEGQRKMFNTNYAERVTVNTDWVTEDFSDNLRELMISERILIDNRPAKLNSKSMELQKHVNTKMINYTLEFEFATDIINNVI
jgi:hypothetical protein